MRHDWIIDVLTDLKKFARSNDLDALAEQLDAAELVAKVELTSRGEGAGFGRCGEQLIDRRVSGRA